MIHLYDSVAEAHVSAKEEMYKKLVFKSNGTVNNNDNEVNKMSFVEWELNDNYRYIVPWSNITQEEYSSPKNCYL